MGIFGTMKPSMADGGAAQLTFRVTSPAQKFPYGSSAVIRLRSWPRITADDEYHARCPEPTSDSRFGRIDEAIGFRRDPL